MLFALISLAMAQDPDLRFEVHGELVVGAPINLSIEGAEADQRFYILYSETEGLTCPPVVAPTCIDLDQPRILRTAITDANGNAYAELAFPSVAFGMRLQVVTETEASNVVYIDAEPAAEPPPVNDG